MSRKLKWLLMIPIVILSGSIYIHSLHTSADQLPVGGSGGSVDDPLVTKSYVDEQIKKLLDELSTSSSKNQVDQADETNKELFNSSSDILVLKLEKGQTLYGGAGAEFVVRTGSAVVYTSDENGIADLTAGRDLLNKESIPLNHLLLFPRDGRAIQTNPNADTEIYVIVRGSYLLLDADGNTIQPN